MEEEKEVAAKVAVWNPRLVRVRVSVMLKDGSDLEGSNHPRLYRIVLADSQRKIATEDIQEAVDKAGMSGHVKIF